uniref:Guided entry of tail-anchored proteins factor 1 n=1 Tax=Acartia pacifica TaxID=335913 RepID=A0A0U2LEU1_ACAPC|nr:tryptophan-rich protein [Acartia pacifica]
MLLMLWGFVLSCLNYVVAPITKYLANITSQITDSEIEIIKQVRDLKKELRNISMMDEFATYAKTERKINKLTEKLELYKGARKTQADKASSAIKITLNSILGLATMMTVWSYWEEPIVTLPPQWIWPLGWLVASPGVKIPGGVSLPVWMMLCRSSLRMLPSLPRLVPVPSYHQVPLD